MPATSRLRHILINRITTIIYNLQAPYHWSSVRHFDPCINIVSSIWHRNILVNTLLIGTARIEICPFVTCNGGLRWIRSRSRIYTIGGVLTIRTPFVPVRIHRCIPFKVSIVQEVFCGTGSILHFDFHFVYIDGSGVAIIHPKRNLVPTFLQGKIFSTILPFVPVSTYTCKINSLGKDGGFASKVIGSIATGQTGGSITGDSAVEAMNSYFAVTSDTDAMQISATGENIPPTMVTSESDTVMDSPIPATPLALEGDCTVDVSPTRDSEIAMHAGGSPAVTEQSTIPTSSSIQQAAMNRVLLGQMGNSVTDVEIGGGKIQGREIIPGRGQIQFAMYNARQYEKPEGHFTEQTSRDGEKWYKVYATTRIEKTPTVQDERGRMQYDERKVAAMPKAPARRH